MRRDDRETPFDMRRHLMEAARLFLPILTVVATLAVIAFAIWAPQASFPSKPSPVAAPWRIGLLPVIRPDGTSGPLPFDPAFVLPRPVDHARAPVAARFDAPMGGALGAMTYNAQPFLNSRHLGDDLNGIGGRDSDRGDPVYAAGDGEIQYAGWAGDGWGHVVAILHRLRGGEAHTTWYGHLERIRLPVGATVRRGEKIGSVGKADGRYLAHLHFEVRSAASLDPGAGYADGPLGRVSGEAFLAAMRGAPDERQNEAVGGPWDTQIPAEAAAAGAQKEGGDSRLRISTEPPVKASRPAQK